MGDYEVAARLLTEMGALAMQNGLRRQLGRALHLLGELHLRRERPELGTQHLSEAFSCFMGFDFQKRSEAQIMISNEQHYDSKMVFEPIYESPVKEVFVEEAEQSRLMMAISAGQELMASYFNLIRESGNCSVAQMKVIEWKLSHSSWWVKRQHHNFIPCLCPIHNRTPLDVLRVQLELKANMEKMESEFSEGDALLGRIDTIPDMRMLRSSHHQEKET